MRLDECDLAGIDAAASVVLDEVYDQSKDLPENQAALSELKSNFENYSFENFTNV
jgi:hypothetical protein